MSNFLAIVIGIILMTIWGFVAWYFYPLNDYMTAGRNTFPFMMVAFAGSVASAIAGDMLKDEIRYWISGWERRRRQRLEN
jgi:hypothetical protein